jgi:N-acetylmuramoyl-L-alanine amidase
MLIMLLSIMSVPVSAVSVNIEPKELDYFLGIKSKSTEGLGRITISLNGQYINDSAYLINETTYIPLRAAATLAGAEVDFDSGTRTARVRMKGLDMTVSGGSYVAVANGRPMLTKTPSVILNDGRMYVPIRVLAKALGLEVQWDPRGRVELFGVPTPLPGAEDYYKPDELYWLSRIISAESRGEPLLGQIAVGNVVRNRVAHPEYPSTIYGVIFDRKYGVQFSPVANGSIYREPAYTSVMAAKICLEGVSVSDRILFFMEPRASTSSWIYENRRYAFTIGNHYFFY